MTIGVCASRASANGQCVYRIGVGLCSKGVAPICVEYAAERPRLTKTADCVSDEAGIRTVAEKVAASNRIAIHVQLVDIAGHGSCGRALAIGFEDDSVVVVDLLTESAQSALPELGNALTKPLLVGVDLKHSLGGLAELLPTEPTQLLDLQLASITLAHGDIDAGHSLDDLRARFLGEQGDRAAPCLKWTGHLTRIHGVIASQQVRGVLGLAHGMLQEVSERGLEEVLRLEHQVLPIAVRMSLRGLPINEARWFEASAKMETELNSVRRGLERSELLQDSISDVAALRERLASLRGTFQSFVIPVSTALRESPDGRIRGEVHQYGTATGRFTIKGSPLLGMPREYHLRDCFEAEEGTTFVRADYSCFELRVLAGITGDAALLRIFQLDGDAHRLVAAELLQKSLDLVTDLERNQIKQVGFGICFDMKPAGIAAACRDLGVELSTDQAAQFRAAFLERFAGVARWQAQVLTERAERVETLLGRPRRFSGSETDGARLAFPVQGLAADIMKRGLVHLNEGLLAHGAAIALVWHDELVVEAPVEHAAAVADWLRSGMKRVAEEILPTVTFKANVKITRTLGDV